MLPAGLLHSNSPHKEGLNSGLGSNSVPDLLSKKSSRKITIFTIVGKTIFLSGTRSSGGNSRH